MNIFLAVSGSNGCPSHPSECNAYCHNIGCHRGGYCGGMMILKITCTCLRPCSWNNRKNL